MDALVAKLDEETRNALKELREIRKAENAEKDSGKSSEMLSEMGYGGFGFLLPMSDEDWESFSSNRCACMAPGHPPDGAACGVRIW